ncbi:type II secretion system protein N, partial [Burkholderia multivorans]|nr:type II secretion system protein N [Burkholderia multivorans]
GWTDWRLIGRNAFGQLTVTIDGMSSRVSRVKPLGSYRAVLQAKGTGADLDLTTTQGPLFLDGHGTFGPGSGAFRGTAHAAPEQQANLAGLLNLLGRPIGNGQVSLIYGGAMR